jgi:hypothetical protein
MFSVSAIFTPDGEPYLGRESVLHFDKVLSAFIADQQRIAAWTRGVTMTPVLRASSETVPSASSIAFSRKHVAIQIEGDPNRLVAQAFGDDFGIVAVQVEVIPTDS